MNNIYIIQVKIANRFYDIQSSNEDLIRITKDNGILIYYVGLESNKFNILVDELMKLKLLKLNSGDNNNWNIKLSSMMKSIIINDSSKDFEKERIISKYVGDE